jgi:formylglycine-generating enzyme required for sulfatase activity
VGIRNFEDEQLAEIPYAVDDAVDLAHMFSVELGLIDPVKIVLALSGEPQKPGSRERLDTLLAGGAQEEPAEQSDIYRLLSDQGQVTGAGGVFVVAIATHGFSDQGSQYLAAADSRNNHLTSTGIPVNEVFDDIDLVTKTPRRIVLLDACKERLSVGTRAVGPNPSSAMSPAFASALAAAAGQVVLSATTQGGYSYDDPERKNGVFTAAVIDGLRGNAPADERSLITAENLAEYVDDTVRSWVQSNRPNHADISKGIESTFGGAASSMPLAVDPDGFGKSQAMRQRADQALEQLRITFPQSEVITAAAFDQAKTILSADPPGPGAQELMGWVERLEDDTEQSQKALLMYLGSLEEAPESGSSITDPILPEMVLIPPAGEGSDEDGRISFMMGDLTLVLNRKESALPKHKVTLEKPFSMSKTEVTFEQWNSCVEHGGCDYKPEKFSIRDTGNYPVVGVTWCDARQYVEWLSKETGQQYRLPTEAEWEYAARVGNSDLYGWGDKLPVCERHTAENGANFDGCGGKTFAIEFQPNAWGLHDMHGNVWEWVEDCYHKNYEGAPIDGSAWLGRGADDQVCDEVDITPPINDCRIRIVRGGALDNERKDLRSAHRNLGSLRNKRYDTVGIRVVRDE